VHYSPEVIEYLKGGSFGWQTRMSDGLKQWVVRHKG